MSTSKSAEDTVHSAPLVEFLNTLPSPLTTTLATLAPAIARVRHVVQIVTWKASWEDCWLFLGAWWAVCLIPEFGLRCAFFHPLVCAVVAVYRARAGCAFDSLTYLIVLALL